MLALNRKRNETLLAALARIVAACNAINIEPVLLKGAARLVDGTYPSTALRFLGDLDVLIPAERAADVVAALQANGFHPDPTDQATPPSHHHLPMLHDRERGGGVELHTDVVGAQSAGIIQTDWFRAGTYSCAFRDLRVCLPDPTRSIGHIIAHDQIEHHGYRLRKVELRQILDLAVIRARHDDAIDWAELDHRFCRMERGEVLATYLGIAETLLGQPAPRLSQSARRGAIRDLRRVVAPSRSQCIGTIARRFASLTSDYVAQVRRDPVGVLRLLDWRKWPGRNPTGDDRIQAKPSDLVVAAERLSSPAWRSARRGPKEIRVAAQSPYRKLCGSTSISSLILPVGLGAFAIQARR